MVILLPATLLPKRNSVIHDRVHNSWPLDPILSHLKPIYILKVHFLKVDLGRYFENLRLGLRSYASDFQTHSVFVPYPLPYAQLPSLL